MQRADAVPQQPKLRPVVWLVAFVLVGGVLLLCWYTPTFLLSLLPKLEFSMTQTTEPPPPVERLPEEFATKPLTYGAPPAARAPVQKEPIPIAAPTFPRPAPPVATPAPVPAPAPAPVVKAATEPLPDFLKLWEAQDKKIDDKLNAMAEQNARAQQRPVQAQGGQVSPQGQQQAPQKPKREAWIITPTDISLKRPDNGKERAPKDGKDQKEETTKGDASQLIKPAVWAIPKYPLKTLYRSQSLPGRLLDAVNSDIPGQMRIELTVPVFDKFHYNAEILPKGTLVVAMQEGKPSYGASRLQLKLEQLELPTGEVISLKAAVGDSTGASGIQAKANNHLGKLLLATGISALLNIGVQSAAGTPGAGHYFQNPAQLAAGDVGRSVQRDAQSVVDRELRIPPTLTIAAGTACTLTLSENVQFSRAPLVIR